jgi:hypothetical protein
MFSTHSSIDVTFIFLQWQPSKTFHSSQFTITVTFINQRANILSKEKNLTAVQFIATHTNTHHQFNHASNQRYMTLPTHTHVMTYFYFALEKLSFLTNQMNNLHFHHDHHHHLLSRNSSKTFARAF